MKQKRLPIISKAKDVVYTPDDIAKDIVSHFAPSGKVLEPCRGDGAFYRHLPADSYWCEIAEGKDFFQWNERVDWIVSNPPFSIFANWMRHSFEISDNIVYLLPITKVFNSYTLIQLIYSWGGIKEVYVIGGGSMLKSERLGFAIGAVHFVKGYEGGINIAFRQSAEHRLHLTAFGDGTAAVNPLLGGTQAEVPSATFGGW